MCCTRLAENTGRKKSLKNSPYAHHRTSLSGCIFATKACIDNRKKLLNSNISPTCFHNMVNFGTLAAEIQVWGSPANLNGSRVLASLLHQRRSTEINQTLHDVWPSLGLLHYTFSWALAPNGILQGAKFTLRSSLAFSYIGSVTARYSSSGRQPHFAALSRRRHLGPLYSEGRPSRCPHSSFVLFLCRIVVIRRCGLLLQTE